MPYDYGMTGTRRAQDADKFIVRFPDGMRDRIADAAKTANRTMNAEIVVRLQASFGAATGPAIPADALEVMRRQSEVATAAIASTEDLRVLTVALARIAGQSTEKLRRFDPEAAGAIETEISQLAGSVPQRARS